MPTEVASKSDVLPMSPSSMENQNIVDEKKASKFKFVDLLKPLNSLHPISKHDQISILVKEVEYKNVVPRVTWMEEEVDKMNIIEEWQLVVIDKFSYGWFELEDLRTQIPKKSVGKLIHLDLTMINKTHPSFAKHDDNAIVIEKGDVQLSNSSNKKGDNVINVDSTSLYIMQLQPKEPHDFILKTKNQGNITKGRNQCNIIHSLDNSKARSIIQTNSSINIDDSRVDENRKEAIKNSNRNQVGEGSKQNFVGILAQHNEIFEREMVTVVNSNIEKYLACATYHTSLQIDASDVRMRCLEGLHGQVAVEHLARTGSDHAPLLLTCGEYSKTVRKSFRVCNGHAPHTNRKSTLPQLCFVHEMHTLSFELDGTTYNFVIPWAIWNLSLTWPPIQVCCKGWSISKGDKQDYKSGCHNPQSNQHAMVVYKIIKQGF
ncbi:hypothetical protein FXO38_33041 [Capsicum annuum]|nr:hypothetical protein FXO38_33041 [Capsicum annuum]